MARNTMRRSRAFRSSRKLLANKYDIGPFRSEVNDKINTITPDIVSRFRGFGDPSNKPIFVVGMPRSGTTLTEQIIAAHSQAAGVGELKRVHLMARKLAGDKGMARDFVQNFRNGSFTLEGCLTAVFKSSGCFGPEYPTYRGQDASQFSRPRFHSPMLSKRQDHSLQEEPA